MCIRDRSNDKYLEALSRLIPPVGQNLSSGKGPITAFRKSIPPIASAGKSFNRLNPESKAVIASLIVATPGIVGILLSFATSKSSFVQPGLKIKSAFAFIASSN